MQEVPENPPAEPQGSAEFCWGGGGLGAWARFLRTSFVFLMNLSGDTFSIEVPQNLLRTKRDSKNISSGILEHFLWQGISP